MPELDELLSKQMPHSDAAEQAVLGAMLIDSRCIPQVVEALRPEDFYTKQHLEVYGNVIIIVPSKFKQRIGLSDLSCTLKNKRFSVRTILPF